MRKKERWDGKERGNKTELIKRKENVTKERKKGERKLKKQKGRKSRTKTQKGRKKEKQMTRIMNWTLTKETAEALLVQRFEPDSSHLVEQHR
jgi:hypothetical protein